MISHGRIRLDETRLRELNRRLRSWNPQPSSSAPSTTDLDEDQLHQLVTYWADDFDWRAREEKLNEFRQERHRVGDLDIHVMTADGHGEHRLPVLALHGWPSTFELMTRLADSLVRTHGVTVIVPSLPGFTFSDPPPARTWDAARFADLLNRLMTEVLGHSRFMVRGTDFGASIALHLGARHPESVAGVHIGGIHLSEPNLTAPPLPDPDATGTSQHVLDQSRHWYDREGAYIHQLSTKPRVLAAALCDSPVGLLAWILEKHTTWCATPDDVLDTFSADDLLSTATLYWSTRSIASSFHLYHADAGHLPRSIAPLAIAQPALEAYFPGHHWWAERQPVIQYSTLSGAAHFPDWENPGHLADDLRRFEDTLSSTRRECRRSSDAPRLQEPNDPPNPAPQ